MVGCFVMTAPHTLIPCHRYWAVFYPPPLLAEPAPVQSRFRLTFFMLLNMLAIEREAADVVWSSFRLWGRRRPGELRQRLQRWVEAARRR